VASVLIAASPGPKLGRQAAEPNARTCEHSKVLTVPKGLNGPGATATRLFANAAITLVALLLVFAAFDDITTDTATRFRAEYTFLVGCAGWLLFVAWSLMRGGHRTLGVVSLVALAGAWWAEDAIGPGMLPGLRPEYIVMTTAYFWFWALAGAMLWLAWRARKRREHPAA
jgi:hypothetical protein